MTVRLMSCPGIVIVFAGLGGSACSFTHSLDDLQGGTLDAGVVYPPHTISITGDNQFTADETFPTSTFGYQAYVAWDRQNIYYGMEGTAVASDDAATWVLAYFGTSGGTTARTRTAQAYGDQIPTLDFDASYHARWKGDDTFISLMRYGPGGWQDSSAFPGKHQRKDRFVEFSIPLSQLFVLGDDPTKLTMVLTMIHEAAPQSTSASVPEGAVSPDGSFNPPYIQSFQFDLTGGTLPNHQQPR
jgi:hypothetical protein